MSIVNCVPLAAIPIASIERGEPWGGDGRTGHIFIGVAAGFPSHSTPSGGHPQAGLSAALGVATLWAATDSKFTMNSYV